MNIRELKDEIDKCFIQGNIIGMIDALSHNLETAKTDNALSHIPFAYNVSVQEEQAGLPMLLLKVRSINELVERSTRLQFYLRRIDFDAAEECMDEIFDFISESDISIYELISTIYLCTFHQEKMLSWMQAGIQNGRLQMGS